MKKPKKRPTIAEIEKILETETEAPIEILPNGEIRVKGHPKSKRKPLTMREDLGGEYAA